MSARPLGLAQPAAAPQALPASFGKYRVSRLLGEGAMGVVYEALDPDLQRAVAIKAIRAPLLAPGAHELDSTRRFHNEAQAAGRLSHPNIVSVYEYAQTGAQRYIAMECVAGVSLHETVALGFRLPLADTLSVVAQLLDALAYAHAQGVWHRDIKPANLMLTTEGRLKVTDFGIARIEGSERTQATTVLGSPGYMAPERYTDEAPDARVDLFSCGVLLYELLTGQAPFRGSAGAVMYQVMHEEPAPPSTLAVEPAVPAAFDAVVARALAKRPAQRFASAAQMRAALDEAAAAAIAPQVSAETMRRLRHARGNAPTRWLPRALAVMPRGGTPPQAAAVPSAPPPTGWDAQALRALEQLLLPQLGPMARYVVRDAARRSHDLASLVATLAREAVDPSERVRFLARAQRLVPAPAPAATPPAVPSSALPVLGTTPMHPGLVEQAARVLAEQIGPIAALLARRAATAAATREAFYAALVQAAGRDADRKALLRRLWALA
ncbi:protein kinase domain-containing protein [Piscinibacter sp.]|uniref:serine/threonine-protein kinase n=1 Tax=Piscinibacter sp. TaxID=1903157 RepID=UPI0039E46981